MKIIYQEEKAKNVGKFHEICLHTSIYKNVGALYNTSPVLFTFFKM